MIDKPIDTIISHLRKNYFANNSVEDSITKKKIFPTMLAFFESHEWSYQIVEEQSLIRLMFNGNNGKWVCYADAKEEAEQFIFYSLLSFKVPEDKRQLIAEFITRVNYGLLIGNFELDFSDGEIRYKTSIDGEGTHIDTFLIKRLVYANVLTTDKYIPGFMKVIYSKFSPAEVIDEIEI